MGRLLRGGSLALLVFALLSCSTEQGGPTGEEANPPPREVTKEVTKEVTVAEAPKKEKATAPEAARTTPAPPPPEAPPPAATPPAPAATQEGSPEDVLALQYRLINAGDYEGAYALFDQSSKQLVSLEQYRAYFEANAPYSITDYSFPSVDDQGDAATVQVALTASGGSGQTSYEASQSLVREGEAWRVVVRDDQASAFARTGQETAQYESEETTPEETTPEETAPEETAQYEPEEPSAGAIPGDGTFLVGEDIQPGTYQTDGGGEFGCYWARLSDTSGEFEGIIANGNPQGPTTVTISASDAAFETSGCSEWTLR